jgi:hypothetical protein
MDSAHNVVPLFQAKPEPMPQMPAYTPEMVILTAIYQALPRSTQLRVNQSIFAEVRKNRDCPVLFGAMRAADRMWGIDI